MELLAFAVIGAYAVGLLMEIRQARKATERLVLDLENVTMAVKCGTIDITREIRRYFIERGDFVSSFRGEDFLSEKIQPFPRVRRRVDYRVVKRTSQIVSLDIVLGVISNR